MPPMLQPIPLQPPHQLIGAGCLLAGSSLLASTLWSHFQLMKIDRAFASFVGAPVSSPMKIPRPELMKELTSTIAPQPADESGTYALITGSHDTGKSTAVRCAMAEIGRGIIYCEVPPTRQDFPAAFGASFGFDFDEDVSFWSHLQSLFTGDQSACGSHQSCLIGFRTRCI